MNTRAMFSKFKAATTETDLPWSKVSSPTPELNSSSLQEHQATELKEPEKERENQSEDASSVLISKLYKSPLSKKENNKSRAWLTPPSQEDWALKELTISENSTVLRDKKERINPSPLPLSRRTLPEELSRARRTMLLLWDKKLQKFKD